MLYKGYCSCKSTQITLTSELKPEEFQPRSDSENCHFCKKHDGVWISDSKGQITLDPNNKTETKRFATGLVEFHFCANCHDLTYALFENKVAVVRLALFQEIAPHAKSVTYTHFDGESEGDGQKRRLKNWTPLHSRP